MSISQPLSEARGPAEIPPASYTERQYVDSRGCIYIRAGVGGNVTWVPRVDRQRRQICGFRPSLSGAQLAQARPPTAADSAAPEILTLGPQDRPRNARPEAEPGAPAPVVAETRPAPSPAPPPTVFTNARPRAEAPATGTAPAQPAARPAPSPAPPPTVFTNARPKAAAPAPVVVATATERRPSAVAAAVSETTRVVPRHVYDNRQNTRNVAIPRGYRSVWRDDRLNPYRAERTLAPSLASASATVPRGYRAAWGDGRLNTRRAQGSAAGEAATDAIWEQTVPRTLRPVPTEARIVTASNNARVGRSPYWQPPVAQPVAPARLSTRSQAGAPPVVRTAVTGKPAYVRVAAFAAQADARRVAQALARSGLTMRLGATGQGTSVVLAGPYATAHEAEAALARLRRAGYGQAVLMR